MDAGDQKNRGSRRFPSRYMVTAILGIAIVSLVVIYFLWPTKNVTIQPLEFNHELHVVEEEEPCDSCHVYYQTRQVAGRPELSACLECHDVDPLSDSPEEEKLVQFIKENRDPPWARVTRIASHVRFSHQRHVVVGEIECMTCHGDITKLTAPPSNPMISINMSFCLKCHRSEKVLIDEKSIADMKKAGLDSELTEDMKVIKNKRFISNEELLAAVEKLSSTPLTDTAKNIVLKHIYGPVTVTVDCIACHR